MATVGETIAPPRISIGARGWLKKNLFSTWYNGLLTLIALWFIVNGGKEFLTWVFSGARWGVITTNLRLFMVGSFPPDQVWRVWLIVSMVSCLLGFSAGAWGGTLRSFALALVASYATLALVALWLQLGNESVLWLVANIAVLVIAMFSVRGREKSRRWVWVGWLASFVAAAVLLSGFEKNAQLPAIGTNLWGGLLLTFLLSVISLVLSFPIGVLLALGRRSRLPVVKLFSTLYIELIRGVPLVSVLFMAQIMVPLFFPEDLRIDRVLRAIAGFTLFTAAYVAENVRGGLQAIPEGQIEAAQAVGLNNALTTLLIVLPQALRAVIPANVGVFISLFKDTTLVLIVGLLDLLSVGRSVLAQGEWQGLTSEVYLFIASVFFIFSYAMSFASYRLEAALGVGKR